VRIIPHLEPRDAKLAAHFHTIAIDHRGWGDSDAPADGYALADLAADAEGVIRELSLTFYVLVGHSTCGEVAQLMALRRPAGLAGLVLVAPSPPQPMTMPAEAREIISRETVEATIDNVATAKSLSAEDREQVITDSLRGALPANIAWPRATSLEDITAHVGAIDAPVIVIAGELDRVDSLGLLKSELLSRVPQGVMYKLPGTGHLSMLESPDALALLIQDFCRSLQCDGSG